MPRPLAPWIRAIGVALFAATAFLPVHSCDHSPRDFEPKPPPKATPQPASKPPTPRADAAQTETAVVKVRRRPDLQVPAREIADDLRRGFREGGVASAVWEARQWYPYLLVPFWAAALALVALGGARVRRAAAWGCFALSVVIAAFEFQYISHDYVGFLPASLSGVEVAIAWLVVCATLSMRRGGRPFVDVEAIVSAQALLAVLHGLTFPVDDVRGWISHGHATGPIVATLFSNYLLAYWIALLACGLVAAPAYRSRRVSEGVPAA